MSDLLQKKFEYLQTIKKITAAYNFTGDEAEADDYISLINKREYIFKDIEDIDHLLAETGVVKNYEMESKIKKVIEEIVKMDNKNKMIAEKIRNSINLKIGEVKKGKKMSAAYYNEAVYSDISSFDSRR